MDDRFIFLKSVHPFDTLQDAELAGISGQLESKSYEKNERIYSQGYSEINHLSLIVKGSVEKHFLDRDGKKQFVETLSPGETFGGISIFLNNRISVRNVIALEPTILYNLPWEDFTALCQLHDSFAEYFTDRFAKRMLDSNYYSYVGIKSPQQTFELADSFYSKKVVEEMSTKLVSAEANLSIADAARLMTTERSGYVLILNENKEMVGVITDMDFRNKVVATGKAVHDPISDIMHSPVLSIGSDTYVYEALLLMFKRKIKYLPVLNERGELVGILTQHRLLSSQSRSPFLYLQGVLQAASLEELRAKWQQVPFIVQQMIERGAKTEIINLVITTVSDAISQNIIQQGLEKYGPAPVRFLYMVLGSEGRREQTLKTDQDNAIIYEDLKDPKQREAVRDYFLKLATFISDQLNEVGFSYCKGGFMAKNPKWSHSLSHWKANYTSWLKNPDSENLLRTIIFYDCRAVFGEKSLMESLQGHLLQELETYHQRFFVEMANAALQVKPPLTLFRNFQLITRENKKQVLDIKRAMMPLSDFARIYALKHQIMETNTVDRIKALQNKGVIPEEDAEELIQAFNFMMQLRLGEQVKAMMLKRERAGNDLDPKDLSNIQRVTLKETFRIVEKFQTRLRIQFTGNLYQ